MSNNSPIQPSGTEMKRLGKLLVFLWSICWVYCPAVEAGKAAQPYSYPYANPFEATVMETPASLQLPVPENVPTRVFKIHPFPKRKIPDVFWYENGLRCSLVYQTGKAPLIIVVAGTGARFDSPKMTDLQKALYQAGFHVLSISSPTCSEFIVNASSAMMPGNLQEDAKDLYRVMQLAWDEVKDEIEVSHVSLAGYSLGATEAAFVAKLDTERRAFGFHKVLLINPAVNLYSSVARLDEMLLANIPGGIEHFSDFVDDTFARIAEITQDMGYVELSGEYLYRVYRKFHPSQEFLASLIGFAFRFDSSSMIFTADVMQGGGYVVPKGAHLTNSTSLTPYSMVLFRTGFVDYFKEYFFPFWQRRQPGLTMQQMIGDLSLTKISDYLRNAKNIWVLDNEDDIILAAGEIGQLREIFGKRAQIYPTGGHCGNMSQRDVVNFIIGFFREDRS